MLDVRDLTKEFKGFKAVDGVSFQADPGEIFGLLGPNGAGKTTTIRLISTILTPTWGTALVCGNDVRQDPQSARRHIGMLTTEMGVYDRLTGREYLRYFGSLYSMSPTGIERKIDELGMMLEMGDLLERRTNTYSTGMKQKLSIARCVLHDPDIVILDEPTSGLDVLSSQTVLAFMRHCKSQGKLVVLSTHHMPDAERLCDRAVIMHRGKLLALQTVPELKRRTGTGNLEDAFLSMVRGDTTAPSAVVREKKSFLRPRQLIALAIALAVIILLNLLRLLQK
ncbi:MAG: ATP-binding cassette domain-containing protein [Chloroflexi bacterium]|nr:ATP-binding cassette domain-containing protein [Chloroflexota bacterium]